VVNYLKHPLISFNTLSILSKTSLFLNLKILIPNDLIYSSLRMSYCSFTGLK